MSGSDDASVVVKRPPTDPIAYMIGRLGKGKVGKEL